MPFTLTPFPLDLLPHAAGLERSTGPAGQDLVWCAVRRRYVATQPEELVRQAFLAHVAELDYPLGLMQLEKKVPSSSNRLDLLCLDRDARSWLLAEFKAPQIPVQRGIAQLADYARTLRSPWCLVANGTEAICVHVDYERSVLSSVAQLPRFGQLGLSPKPASDAM